MELFGGRLRIGKPSTPKIIPAGAGRPFKRVALTNKEFDRWSANSKIVSLGPECLNDEAHFLKKYFDGLHRYIPSVSDAVWKWQNLCSTKQSIKFEGGTEAQHRIAMERIQQLDKTLSPFKTIRTGGMDSLIATWFHYIFLYGRFAGQLKITNNADGVADFELVNPFSVTFKKDLTPIIETSFGKGIIPPEETFYYYAMNMTQDNPYGNSMIEASETFLKIVNEMIQDMRYSSSNAGVPRLHFKIKQPPIMQGEDVDDYVTRVNTYFDSTIEEFSEIGPDDNFYTWDDVQIALAGGGTAPSTFVWKTNKQVIDEEIITAFHLFPWLMSKSN